MGRPKGSKNKPKVTTALVGEVISKPFPRIPAKETHKVEMTFSKKEIAPYSEPVNGDKMIDEGAPTPVLSDEEVNNAALKEAQHTVTRRRKLSVKDKAIEEKIEFLFADMKSLRTYVMRIEDLIHVTRNPETNQPEPIVVKKRRSKPEVNKEESTNETE